MSERFYVEGPVDGNSATLTGSEAHHFLHVLRGKVGDEIALFDGMGEELTARVTKVARSEVELAILDRCEISRELPLDLCLGVALPKGDRQKWLVEKLTELGVRQLFPLETQRGVAQPTDQAIARLKRVAIEASKQCGRNGLMVIQPSLSLNDFLQRPSDRDAQLLFADMQADDRPQLVPPFAGQQVFVAIGPEGGWTDQEQQLARQHRWQSVSLGSRTLRVETAAIVLAAWASLACRQ